MKLTHHRDGSVSITLTGIDEIDVVGHAFEQLAAWDTQYARWSLTGDSPEVRRRREETFTARAQAHRNVGRAIRSIRDHVTRGSSKHYGIV